MEKPGLSRRRRVAIWTLIVLASLLCVVSVMTMWVKRQMLDNTAWRDATTEIVQDSEVQSALSTYLVNQLYDNVDVAAALQQRLPSNLKQLGPPLAGALRDPATRGVEFLFTRPRIQTLIVGASSLAQQRLVNVLENKTGYGIETGKGVVTLDLHQLVVDVGTDLGLPASALEQLPATAGTITLMRSDQLAAAQTGVRVVRVLSVWLLVAVFAMYAAAIWLARGARRPVLRNVGWALVLVGLVVLVARRMLGNYIVDALAAPGYVASSHRLWLIGTAILAQIGAAAILYGAIAVLGAVLAGPTTAAVAVRSRIAPVLNERPGIAWGVAGGAYLLLLLWAPTHALRTWWGILILAALLAAGLTVLLRQMRTEVAAVAAPKPALAEELERLRALHEAGAITDEEYERGKRIALT